MKYVLHWLQPALLIYSKHGEAGIHSFIASRDSRVPSAFSLRLFDACGSEVFVCAECLQIRTIMKRADRLIGKCRQLIDKVIEISTQSQRLFRRHADQVSKFEQCNFDFAFRRFAI